METQSFDHCFVCGSRNEAGLQLDIVSGDGEARAEFQPDARWEGYQGVVHGGVLSAVFDDLMFHAIYSVIKQLAVTTSLEVRFLLPARIGTRLYCRARVAEPGAHGYARLVDVEGEIRDQDKRLLATSKSQYAIMSQARMDDFMGRRSQGSEARSRKSE
jgi:uncharacterized protein (TIGR00369 family)